MIIPYCSTIFNNMQSSKRETPLFPSWKKRQQNGKTGKIDRVKIGTEKPKERKKESDYIIAPKRREPFWSLSEAFGGRSFIDPIGEFRESGWRTLPVDTGAVFRKTIALLMRQEGVPFLLFCGDRRKKSKYPALVSCGSEENASCFFASCTVK